MNILFTDFHLVACDFFKFDWCEILSSYVNFSFNILEVRNSRVTKSSYGTESRKVTSHLLTPNSYSDVTISKIFIEIFLSSY